MGTRILAFAATVAALSLWASDGMSATRPAPGDVADSFRVADDSASMQRGVDTSQSAGTTDVASEMLRVRDQYGKEIDYWEAKLKNEPEPQPAEVGEEQSEGSWVGVTWLEVKGEWSKLQAATEETWATTRQSFEKAFDTFKRAWSEAHPG